MKNRKITPVIIVIVGLALMAAACSHSRESGTATTVPTSTTQDICKTTTLEATEIGITKDTIRLQVMADVGSPLSPGLFQGAFDGTNAWVNYLNKNGGLACRKVVLVEHDSKLNPIETTNGFLRACEESLAQVGSNALLAFNVEALNTCPDKAGNPTGLPDFAEGAAEPSQQCSNNVFLILGSDGTCPFTSGERDYKVEMILPLYLKDTFGPLRCGYVIPSDIPSTISITMPAIRASALRLGTENVVEKGYSGFAPQAAYGEILSAMKEGNVNCAYNGSDSNALLKWRSEALAQGGFEDVKWSCFYQCYTKIVRDSAVAEGTYLWMTFLPYEERDTNRELDLFLTEIDEEFPDTWAAISWASGRLFEKVLGKVVEKYGVNGITRARILEEGKTLEEFNANGWFSPISFGEKPQLPRCKIIVQVQNKKFVRIFPKDRGAFNCLPQNQQGIRVDSLKTFRDGPSNTGTLIP